MNRTCIFKNGLITGIFLIVLLGGRTDLFAEITITLLSPSYETGNAPQTTMAPTRDFMITGLISGADANEVANLKFSLYKGDDQTPVRTVDTFTFTNDKTNNLYVEFDQISNGRATPEDVQAGLHKYPMPDLVYDSNDPNMEDYKGTPVPKTVLDPSNKAVIADDGRFSAIVLGGATKDFFTDYGYQQDLEGEYHLKVDAYDRDGHHIQSVKIESAVSKDGKIINRKDITESGLELKFQPNNVVFSRFTNKEHNAKITKLANKPEADPDKYKIMLDFFPGYWTDYGRYGVFAELLGRWEENDWIEYQYAPKTLGIIYDIEDSCATMQEIYRIAKSDHFENKKVETTGQGKFKLKNQVYLYHYDLGDESLSYTRRDGSVGTMSGNLVLFKNSIDPNTVDMNKEYDSEAAALEMANNKYSRLDLTRVDLYHSDANPESIKDNINQLNDVKKQVSLVGVYESSKNPGRSLILARSEQAIGLHGVVTPLPVDPAEIHDITAKDVTQGGGSTRNLEVVEYSIENRQDHWINNVHYTLKDPDGNPIETRSINTGLTRTMAGAQWARGTSIFEFKAMLDDDLFDKEGVYTLSIEGRKKDAEEATEADLVERTSQTVDILITRTGILNAANQNFTDNQLAIGDTALDFLIENNVGRTTDPNYRAYTTFANAYINAPSNEAAGMLSQLSGSQTVSSVSKLAFNPLITSINRLDAYHNDLNDPARFSGSRDFWATYIHQTQDIDGINEIRPFDITGNGLAVGYDRAFEYGRLGGAFVYMDSYDSGFSGKNELDDMTAVVYGKVNLNGLLWFNALFGYSWRDYQTERVNQWTGFSESLNGNFSGNGAWANFRFERELRMPGGLLIPFIGYEGNWNQYDQYSETGGVSGLTFNKRNEDYGFLQAGARTCFRARNLDLGLRAMYVHRLSGPDQAEYTAGITGADGYNYQFNGLAVRNSTDFLDLNLDLRYQLSDWTNLFTGYNGLYGNRSSGHMLTAGFNTQW